MTALLSQHQLLPMMWHAREELREKGQFWTPLWVSKAMVSYVLKSDKSIFDPACGKGAFLEGLLNLERAECKFYGMDIDDTMLADSIYDGKNVTVKCGDYLRIPASQKWGAIVANPPYIRHHRLDPETKAYLKALCKQITGFSIDGRAGYHIYFLLHALNMLELGGRLAFIMPADTCEGAFATSLWLWITQNYCLEAVVSFAHEATPFPGVDTNPVIFFIKNASPQADLIWARVMQRSGNGLCAFVQSNFCKKQDDDVAIEVVSRSISEALTTGLSRARSLASVNSPCLGDFAKTMRGIATGANEFFFMTSQQAAVLDIPDGFLRTAIGRTRDALRDVLTTEDINALEKRNRPTRLLYLRGNEELPIAIKQYIASGEASAFHVRALISQRNPWYKMETRNIPPILFSYLGRRNSRFVLNEVGALPLTCFLCVFPKKEDFGYAKRLWKALNHPDTLANLHRIGKSYGGGAIKVEPRGLERLAIPVHIVDKYDLHL